MNTRDIALTVTTSYQAASAISDTDQNDVGTKWKNVTITNDTDVTIMVKSSNKSSVSGTGRSIPSGDSFNYLEIDAAKCFIKASGTPTGSVVISLSQEGGE